MSARTYVSFLIGSLSDQRFNCLLLILLAGMIHQMGLAENTHSFYDVEYARTDHQSLLLDITLPKTGEKTPGIILVHGGGWSSGKKEDMSFLFNLFNNAGFSCFSINYRLAPEYRWPACLDDTISAIRWVKTHAAEYKTDPNKLAILGYSAGGHLACMAAVEAPSELTAVIALAAPVDHEADSQRRGGLSPSMQKLLDRPEMLNPESRQTLRSISPIHFVHGKLPPFMLVHGTEDQSVLYSQSIDLQAQLKENNIPCELITLEGATHSIAEWSKVDYQNKMLDWLNRQLENSPKVNQCPRVVTVGSQGEYSCVQRAVDSIPDGNSEPVTISIEPGTYKELITIPVSKPFITFQGMDAKNTILSYHLNARMIGTDGNEIGTFNTPSVRILASDFTAENITFQNTAGDVGQALAVAVLGDRTIFRNCRFLGWQDTIYDQAGRHYYENCTIEGHCDFIFGGGTAFFEKCRIHCLEGSYITAASTPQDKPFGYVFSNCTITGHPLRPKTYLGRPWRDYANVIFLNTRMDNVIRPEGWHNWSKPEREKTAKYAEYNSTGPGGSSSQRVTWSRQLTQEEAKRITVETVLSGQDQWNPLK